MNVVIYGAGQLGTEIARHLILQDINVTLVDISEKAFQKIQNISGINRFVGNVFDVKFLKELNLTEQTYVIAAMHSDEQNILACKITDSFFKVKAKISFLKSQIFWQGNIFELFLRENFGIDIMIQPESEIADKICNMVQVKGALDIIRIPNFIAIRTLCIPNSEIINTNLAHLPEISDINLFILSITRDNRTFFPSSADSLLPGDEVFFIISENDLQEAMRLFGYPQENTQNVLIEGTERIVTPLTKELLLRNSDISITIIEDSLKQAENFAQQFPKCTIMNKNLQESSLIEEIGSRYFDTAIVCSNHEKTNILTSLLLRQCNISRIITLSTSQNYNSLFLESNGHSMIDPGNIVLQSIIQNLGQNKNFSVVSGQNHFFYIIDVKITEQFDCAENNVLSIVRDDLVIPIFRVRYEKIDIIQKDTTLQADDRVILISTQKYIQFVEKFFFGYSFIN